ncbi:MAG TPA: histidine kinase dimerization/phospho-acceptor domain-containing protein [Chloroflexota bacterium]|jgi:signal transduction histidine kinase
MIPELEGPGAAPVDRGDGGADRFLDLLAHDLNAPITYLLGYSEMLAGGHLAGQDAAEAQVEIYREACRMTDLVAVMLEATRARSGRLWLAPVHVGLDELLERIVRRWHLARPDVRLAVRGPRGGHVLADPDRLTLALHALVGLAAGQAYAVERGVSVELRAEAEANGWRFAVTGPSADASPNGTAARALAYEALSAIGAAHGGAFAAEDGRLLLTVRLQEAPEETE